MSQEEVFNVVNVEDAKEEAVEAPDGWISFYKILTPSLARMGHLGMNLSRVPPGQSACPFHTHQIEDEIFFVLSGRGIFRYGERVREIRTGDTLTCPAATGTGHQIANPFGEDLVYLAVGMNDPNEVCTYPDSGQIMVRSLHQNGFLRPAEYFDGQPSPSPIMTMPVEPST